ncbi:MAG TPA: type II secretion system protein [Phycisphaerae bacterium]|nr:type II secretion system protein [Phycisphaerae bacterium]HRR84487.1 type II secretion system protein [Phycisphaerae bacterium]
MTCRVCVCRRRGFSLVELLVVVGIIALLVAILVPSLNVASRRAKSAATLNTIRVLETGLETFKADVVVGGAYPESAVEVPLGRGSITAANPHPSGLTGKVPFNGASYLVWALAGADLLGTPGFLDLTGNGSWRDDTGYSGTHALYQIDPNSRRPIHPRYGPFVAVESMRLARWNDKEKCFFVEKDISRTPLPSTCFLDAFDQPILYYRANPAGTLIAGVQTALSPGAAGLGIYDLYDNFTFTGVVNPVDNQFGPRLNRPQGLDFGAGRIHPLGQLGNPLNPGATLRTFSYMIWDSNVLALPRPQRPDTFILISAGPDHLYGTPDDIGNIQIKKK